MKRVSLFRLGRSVILIVVLTLSQQIRSSSQASETPKVSVKVSTSIVQSPEDSKFLEMRTSQEQSRIETSNRQLRSAQLVNQHELNKKSHSEQAEDIHHLSPLGRILEQSGYRRSVSSSLMLSPVGYLDGHNPVHNRQSNVRVEPSNRCVRPAFARILRAKSFSRKNSEASTRRQDGVTRSLSKLVVERNARNFSAHGTPTTIPRIRGGSLSRSYVLSNLANWEESPTISGAKSLLTGGTTSLEQYVTSGNLMLGSSLLAAAVPLAALVLPDSSRKRRAGSDHSSSRSGLQARVDSVLVWLERSVEHLPNFPRLHPQECFKRSICEAHNEPTKYGAIGFILRLFFPATNFSVTDRMDNMEFKVINKYRHAAGYGLNKRIESNGTSTSACKDKYEDCLVSLLDVGKNLMDIFLK